MGSLLDRLFEKRDEVGIVDSRLTIKRVYFDRPRWEWRRESTGFSPWLDSRMNPHMVIVGESGSGKSNACRVIVRHLVRKGANVAILDPHNEYAGMAEDMGAKVYDAARNGVNVFELDGKTEREKASEITNMLKKAFRLGEVQGYQLYRGIMCTYARMAGTGRTPNVHDLLYSLKALSSKAGVGESRTLDGITRRLVLLDTGSASRSANMDEVMNGNSVFLLSGLHTGEAQAVYIESFIRKVYGRMLLMRKEDRRAFYVVIDEAEKLGQRSVAGRIAAEGRKYGIGIVAIAQRIKSVDKDIRANSSVILAMCQREPEETNYLANLMSGGNELNRFIEVKKGLRSLGVGRAMVNGSGTGNPCIVSFRLYESRPGLEYEIMKLCETASHEKEVLVAMEKLGFDAESTYVKLADMKRDGTIESYGISCESAYDGKWYVSGNRNSAEHDVCTGVISRHLRSLGMESRMYNNSYGPDVIAYYGRERIAFEYETGSKSIDKTLQMLKFRLNIYPRVTVIVNDAHEKAYDAARMDRVRVMRASEFFRAICAPDVLYVTGA